MPSQSKTAKPAARPPGKVTIPGEGEYFFEMTKLDEVKGGPDYSAALGTAIEGEKMIVGLMRMPAGGSADAHSHPNEQWVFILEGTLEMTVGDKVRRAKPGTAIYVPGNVMHHSRAYGKKDVVFFTVKDTSWGLAGIAAGKPRQ